MRYVRIKNERIFDLENPALKYLISRGCIYFNCFSNYEIVKEANTIEELCDEFVYVNEDVHDFLVSGDLDKAKAIRYLNNVYGANWTDKGLIYVAKMNENGEFELL